MPTFSFVLLGRDRRHAPPFSDGCPRCVFDGAVIPYATRTEGDNLIAFYRHRACGHQWSCQWNARYSSMWRDA